MQPRWLAALAALVIGAATPALARPLEPALQQQLLGLFDSYNKTIIAGKLPEALALRSAEVRASTQKELKTAKDKREMVEMGRMMVPDSVQVLHATINAAGDKVRIITVAAKTMPKGAKVPGAPPPGTTMHSGLTLTFVKQGGAWKFDDQIFGGDPTAVTACKDDRSEPASAYDQNRTVSMGGPIARVDFRPDHTLVVVRVVDEETCAFLAARDDLKRHGLDPDTLVPYAMVEIEGRPHKTDKQKVLVDSLKVQPED